MAVLCVLYLGFKATGAFQTIGYDLRFFWVAGRLWLEGVNPYTELYAEHADRLIDVGFSPNIWAYPPNVMPICLMLGAMSLQTASLAFAAVNATLLVAASALLANVAPVHEGKRFRWFCIHLLAMTTLEAAALTIVVGQMSIIVYFGAALAIFGLKSGRMLLVSIGVALVLMKPQIGLLLITLLAFAGQTERRGLLGGVALNAVFAVPAFIVSMSAASDWLEQVMWYDSAGPANAATAMTGLRAAIFAVSGIDIGNLAAMAIAAAVSITVGIYLLRRQREDSGSALMMSGALAAVALAPLHIYDFLVIGVCAQYLRRLPIGESALAALGAGLMWRSENLARATGLHDANAEIFPGSALATLGALMIATAIVVARLRLARAPSWRVVGHKSSD
jgi:hypothetical protein